MQAFTTLTGIVAPLDRADVDTDQIIPKQYLKTIHRTGLKEGLFTDWRYKADSSPNLDFFMNQPRFDGATILLTRDNFGCGSSREHAPWALLDYGIRVIIGSSFADIFYNNCFQNGMLPVTLQPQEVQKLFEALFTQEGYRLTVDLQSQSVTTSEGVLFRFDIAPFLKGCLFEGLDAIGLTLQYEQDITAYEQRRQQEAPWLFQDLVTRQP